MKLILQGANQPRLEFARSVLDSHGIVSYLRGEFDGGYLCPNPVDDVALFVVLEEDFPSALKVIGEYFSPEEIDTCFVSCPACGESNPGNFEVCWSCGGAIVSEG